MRLRLELVCIASTFALALVLGCESAKAPESSSHSAAPTAEEPAVRSGFGKVDAARATAADAETGDWILHGRTYAEQRHSPLTQITRENAGQLGLAWTFELGSTRGIEATPIVVDGVMYVSSEWSRVYALEAATGKLLWQYDPQVPRAWGRHACCDVVNRGVAVWEGAVFVGTIDGRLVSLDAATGRRNWEVLTIDRSKPYTITGAPRVVKGLVVIGNGGAEKGVRGYVSAYDAKTGAPRWRFYTVPGDPKQPFEHPELEQAAKTWHGEWWTVGGGGTVWDSMVYDPELDLLYVGTGNGSPWTRSQRSPGGGDNLYLSSILAIRAGDGRLAWHYQTTPGDNWDYTAVQPLMLAELPIGGVSRKVLLQAPKNGFFYVLDRATGELLSADPYVKVTWATGVDLKTGRPKESPIADYDREPRLLYPGAQGGHSWHPMSFSPKAGLVFIPAMDVPFYYAYDAAFRARPNADNTGLDIPRVAGGPGPGIEREVKGALIAWDPVRRKEIWRVEHPGHWNGGTLSTAGGLVFQGIADGRFRAYDEATGKILFETQSQTGIMAAPMTYAVDGTQYVAVAAGFGGGALGSGPNTTAAIMKWHNEGRILVWKLGGGLAMPTNRARDLSIPEPIALEVGPERLALGETRFNENCATCHGFAAASSYVVPDLRQTSAERHGIFEQIVLEGALVAGGMPSFEGMLTKDEVAAIQAYVVSRARAAFAEQEAERAGSAAAAQAPR
ncbi:MAG: PQQ-dependent dehydrogenase, methanol/ethanol family [Deltaproteobacteria bacterium]|nr:PQQ-dependent dehydrogenase, methanol/ethanol family [Deltaproteobacteria bacterium]